MSSKKSTPAAENLTANTEKSSKFFAEAKARAAEKTAERVASEKRELAANAKAAAEKTKATQELINASKAKAEKAKAEDKKETPKKGKTVTKKVVAKKSESTYIKGEDELPMAKLQDEVILKGGKWTDIVAKLNKEAKKRNYKIAINVKYLTGHIGRRVAQNPDYLGNLEVTEEGVVAKKTKSSKKSAA